jgi:predicted metal-dependent HD superfamily phosphohydrolase
MNRNGLATHLQTKSAGQSLLRSRWHLVEAARFEAGIRREFEWVDEELYRSARCAVLRRFLERPAIYTMPALRRRFEAPARSNLTRLIGSLQADQNGQSGQISPLKAP